MDVAHVMTQLQTLCPQGPDGITISGGEPFEQQDALEALLRELHGWRDASGRRFDLLCYSGFSMTRLVHRHQALLDLLDAVIPEPYKQDLSRGQWWAGSAEPDPHPAE